MDDFQTLLAPGRRVHLIGIGGVSMCALAEVLSERGMAVTGSDMAESAATRHLRELGIPVHIGHLPDNVGDAELCIRTAAVHDDNPEVAALRARGIPLFARAQAWGAIMRDCRAAVCFSGTHGKTTSTSMMTHAAMAADLDPTVMIGGTLPLLGAGHRVGGGGLMVMEACEYCNSFLQFFPTIAVILNVEADHLDFFRDLDDVVASFRQFALRTPADEGTVIYNLDDAGACRVAGDMPRRLCSFGLHESADVRATNLTEARGLYAFDVSVFGESYAHIALRVPGRHNVCNALAVCACSALLGIPGETTAAGLADFTGAARRFERKGEYRGAQVVDDYAHHPTEIAATLKTALSMGYERVICAFQPHTYSRTAALFEDLAEALKLADRAFVCEIYAAREQNTTGLSARTLAEAVPGSVFCPTLEEMAERLAAEARPGDLILTMGAGNIYTVGQRLLERAADPV